MSERPTHEELDFLMDNPLLGIVYLDKQYRIVRCNMKFEEMFGYKLEEIERKNLDEVVDGDQDMTMISQNGESIHGSGKRKKKDGTYIEVEIYGIPKILGRSISGTLGIYLDITDRKLAEEMLVKSQHGLEERVKERTADLLKVNEQLQEEIIGRKQIQETLRESEEKYRTILESIEESYFEVDIAGDFIFFNDSLSKSLGYSNDELLGMNNRDYISPEAYKKVYNLFNKSYRTGNPIKKATFEIIRKDGSRGFHEMSASLIKNQAGQTIGFRGIAHDITERAKAEEVLRESETRYRELVENAVLGIFQVRKEGKFLMANQRMANIFGYDSQQDFFADVDNINELYVNPEERSIVLQEIDETGHLNGKEMNFKRKDGTPVFCNAYARLIQGKEGECFYEGLLEDITNKKMIETQLQQAQKMEAIGTLAGGVAHDLNNILGGLVSYPELLLLQLPEDSPLRKPILTIQKSGEKAAAVVQDLLTLARRGVVVTEVVELNDVIAEYLKSPEYEMLQSYHPGVHIETHLEKDVLNILGSPTHLSKTVMNLISNAAEAMPEGGKLTVSTENRYIDRPIRGYDNVKEGDYVVLTVSDTGTGIAPDDLEKIFEPFYTKKKMGRSGTGLGMAVVWGTVKDHNGYIHVESAEGKGTTFTLYFPVTRKSLEERSNISSKDYMGKGEAILLVDDVEEQRNIASGMLEELGYSVVSVSSGEEAVEYLKTNKADLLVLDMIMDPGMDGLDTYKKILELHPGQKAIIASGFSETDHVKEVQRLGAGAYIRKPLLLEKIGIAVKGELEK